MHKYQLRIDTDLNIKLETIKLVNCDMKTNNIFKGLCLAFICCASLAVTSCKDEPDAYEIQGLTRRISEQMFERHGIIMTVGIYAIATGTNRRADLQSKVMQTLAKHSEIVQVHGFYYFEKEHRISVDIVPDISVHDDASLSTQLTEELKALVPDEEVTIVIDHNYSE